jgi:hypothetical protein
MTADFNILDFSILLTISFCEGGGCGVGLGLGWGFGAAYGTQYVASKGKFEGIDYENVKTIHEKDKSKILMKETQNRGE